MDAAQAEKLEVLRSLLRSYGSIAVAFSGGVDSTFLLAVACKELGDAAFAVSIGAAFVPEWELNEAREFCEIHGIEQVVRTVDVLSDEAIAANPENRCYLCKRRIFTTIFEVAAEKGVSVVADGTNASDVGDYRPGMQALRELGVKSPLLEAGFTKDDIRACSREMGLSTADRPSYACLATRFPYGERITQEGLARADAAERVLGDLGFTPLRVRCHGDIARIEVVPEQFALLTRADMRQTVVSRLNELGFAYVTLDLQGYRSGSMNEVLK